VDILGQQNNRTFSFLVTCTNVDCSETSASNPLLRAFDSGSVNAMSPAPASTCGTGIFVGDDPVADKVILEGDVLGDQHVVDVSLTHHQGINRGGDVVFKANLSDGSQAIYLAEVVTARFNDVPTDYWAFSFIEALAQAGITAGCGGDKYCPAAPVSRAQMAVFLERGINGSSFTPPAATGNVFNDVGSGDFAANFIEQLGSDGITAGCGNNNYCPNAEVTRAQMAVFLLRAKYGAGYSPPTATGVFGDVDLGHWAVHWIEQLAAEGITAGCGNGNYCHTDPVTRDQMAVFLVRTFGL